MAGSDDFTASWRSYASASLQVFEILSIVFQVCNISAYITLSGCLHIVSFNVLQYLLDHFEMKRLQRFWQSGLMVEHFPSLTQAGG